MEVRMVCDRCRKETNAHTMSMFNTDEICMPCCDLERAHPGYAEAKRIEGEAVLAGNYNFRGVGKPADLRGSDEI